ncbi:hypothetical protein M3599_15330 [Niallia circulans]|uniref:hypothetical protein n=1 Tax=Niallia circulans TaxID=1397 RepID=UPI0020406045|nr:hypothetical protein [Niallia circulans]MCM2982297.1 hypothetical protein [Niallia circulans]
MNLEIKDINDILTSIIDHIEYKRVGDHKAKIELNIHYKGQMELAFANSSFFVHFNYYCLNNNHKFNVLNGCDFASTPLTAANPLIY